MKPVRLLILGTGGMANNHAENFVKIPGVTLVGGVDTRPAQLEEFCKKHNIAEGFASLDDALAWGQFDAVTNVTPDAAHYPTTMPILRAGKHILCEKPLATNAGDAAEMAEAAAKAGVVNMVNLTYRNVPALQRAAELVAEGAIGEIRHMEASYLQSWLIQPAWGEWFSQSQWLWRLSTAHGSKGVLGDIGIHILDFATFVAGLDVAEVSGQLHTFDKAPGGKIGEYVLDANDSATMQVRLTNGALGTVSATRFAAGHMNDLRLRLFGLKGGIEVLFENNVSRLNVCLGDNVNTVTWEQVEAPPRPTVYERFVAAIRGEGVANPDFARAAKLQRVLDAVADSDAQGGRAIRL